MVDNIETRRGEKNKNEFKKIGLLDRKAPNTKITKVACTIFAVISPKAVHTHFCTP